MKWEKIVGLGGLRLRVWGFWGKWEQVDWHKSTCHPRRTDKPKLSRKQKNLCAKRTDVFITLRFFFGKPHG
jgi:hypothetical protein